jgi:hypothetical protein
MNEISFFKIYNASESSRIDSRAHLLGEVTAPFDFGPADGTIAIALQPRLDAIPMENMLYVKSPIILKCFISIIDRIDSFFSNYLVTYFK